MGGDGFHFAISDFHHECGNNDLLIKNNVCYIFDRFSITFLLSLKFVEMFLIECLLNEK